MNAMSFTVTNDDEATVREEVRILTERIRDRIQPLFPHRLAVKFSDPYSEYGPGSPHPHYAIVYRTWPRWLGFIPHPEWHVVFGMFFTHATVPRIECVLQDARARAIVEEEVKRYGASRGNVEHINVHEHF